MNRDDLEVESKRLVSDTVSWLFRAEKDRGAQIKELDLWSGVGLRQLVMAGRTSSSVRNFFSQSLDVGKACGAGGKNRKTWRVWCPGGDS